MLDLFSIPHLLMVLLVVMLLFGTKKLPEISAGLGQGHQKLQTGRQRTG